MQGFVKGQLMEQLATILKLEAEDIYGIVFKTLLLPDTTYQRLFQHLSFMGLDANNSYSQFCCTTVKYFPNDLKQFQDVKVRIDQQNYKQNHYTSNAPDQIIQQVRCRNVLQQRAESKSYLAFQTLFAQSAINILSEHADISNQDLCYEYLENSQRTVFWKQLEQLIPFKSRFQLRDYYNKSFTKCKYQKYISYEDKLTLRDIHAQMPDAKPAVVVDKFIEITGSDQYFKRNLIMYIFNIQNTYHK
ncbi:Hypothetical_protein [Hexamita inflata]|uniref:Hypothetical_protein n=1 Tax=Hexamita inflata TaxID=28002 RepID=A0AA86UJR2_9EUKA|nr:Hypothetical protein HINF_LOCUS46154 [Hexamita inflata]